MEEKKEVLRVDMGSEGTKIVKMDFPSNAHKKAVNVPKKEPKKIEKVVTGEVTIKKKSLGKKAMQTFIGTDDMGHIGKYVLYDVLIPAAKDMAYDMLKGSLDVIKSSFEVSLFGERKRSRSFKDNRSYVSYDRFSSSDRDRHDKRDISTKNRARHNFDDFCLASKGEAEEVIDNLVDLIIDYGAATVGDLYQLIGVTDNYTDRKYGWTDLSSASVSRTRNGYLLNLPKPVLLD